MIWSYLLLISTYKLDKKQPKEAIRKYNGKRTGKSKKNGKNL